MSVKSREGGVLQLWKDVGEDQHGQAPTNLWRTAVEEGPFSVRSEAPILDWIWLRT